MAFTVNVADLLHRPGARRRIQEHGRLDGLVVVATTVPADADVGVAAALEWVSDGILVTGETWAPSVAECRRCLKPVTGEARAHFQELYEARPSDDAHTYRLQGDRLDLEPMVREVLLLELPLAPLCRPDCLGLCPTCGADLNLGPCDCPPDQADPRWSALDELRGNGIS